MSNDIYTTFNKALYKLTETTTPNIVEIDPINISSGTLIGILDQNMGVLKVGKKGFNNTDTGYILGLDSGTAKFYIGNSTNYLNWTGSALNMSGTITATAGTIGGWTIDATTISSANSGERIILDQSNKKLSVFNSSGTEVVKMNYGSTTTQAIQLITIKDNDKRGIEFIVESTRGANARCISIDNPSASISIDMTDAGSTGINIAGASSQGILLTHSGTSAALEINGAGSAPAILITGGDYPCIDLTQNGTATNSFGIRIAQDTNALQDSIFINNDANSHVSWGLNIDRDGATSGGIVAAINIESVNTTDGTKATGINFANATIYSIFNVATDTTAIGTAAGRIPILVGGALKYLAYYNA